MPFLTQSGAVMFPSPDWYTYYVPSKLFFSPDGKTLYTSATYHYKGREYTGIGIIDSINVVKKSVILGQILKNNRTTTVSTSTALPTTRPTVPYRSVQ